MRLYHFTGADHALGNIENRHLKISFSDQVNDLFELCPFDFGERSIRLAWHERIKQHAQKQGFISFTSDWSSPTMWAHYAQSHCGVCYGFDVISPSPLKINYKGRLRKFDRRALTDPAVFSREMAFASRTKSSHWKYENEWRQHISLDLEEIERKIDGENLFFIKFSEQLKLREVIIGDKSKLTSTEVRGALIQSDDVKIITARPAFRDFKIVEQKNINYRK